MREYKSEVHRLKHELDKHKEQTSRVINQYTDWNKKQQDKLTELRREKVSWDKEAKAMRAAEKEIKV